MEKTRKKIPYAWVMFTSCTLIAFALIGLCNNTRSLYLQPVSEGLGVNRAVFSTVLLVGNLISAAISLFLGEIRKKFTLRQLMLFGLSCTVAANVLFAATKNFYIYLAGEMLMGVGIGCSSMTVISLLVRIWFANRNGTVLGALYMATGLGSIILAPVVGELIADRGYQTAYTFHAAVMLAMLVLAFFTIYDDPAKRGEAPFSFASADKNAAGAGEAWGITLKEAAKRPRFWLMLLLGFMVGFGIQSVQGTYGAYIGGDLGYGTVFAASVMSALYIVNMIGKVPLGMLIDRIGVRTVLVICSAAMALSALCLVLLGEHDETTAYLFGACLGLGNIMFTVPCPLVASEVYGKKDVTALTGVFMACTSLGTAVGAPVSNLVFEAAGSYRPLYIAMIALFAVALALSIAVVRPQREALDKEKALTAE